MLWILGYFKIKKIVVKFNPKKYPKLKLANPKIPERVVVSNHSTIIDVVFSFRLGYRSFIGRSDAQNNPILAAIIKINQMVLIDRKNKDSRSDAMKSLHERVRLMKEGKKKKKMVIYAEGTTSNNKGILRFSKGAFLLDTPLKLEALRYNGRISNAYILTTTLDNIMSICLNLTNSITYYTLDGLVEPRIKMDWKEYSLEAKRLICEEFGFENYNGSLKSLREFEEHLNLKTD